MAAIARFGTRVVPELPQIIQDCRARGQLVQGPHIEAFEQGKPAPELQRNDVVVVGKHAGKAFFYGFIDFFKGALGVAKGI